MNRVLVVGLPIFCSAQHVHVRIIPLNNDDSFGLDGLDKVSGGDVTSLDDFMSVLPLNGPKSKVI